MGRKKRTELNPFEKRVKNFLQEAYSTDEIELETIGSSDTAVRSAINKIYDELKAAGSEKTGINRRLEIIRIHIKWLEFLLYWRTWEMNWIIARKNKDEAAKERLFAEMDKLDALEKEWKDASRGMKS